MVSALQNAVVKTRRQVLAQVTGATVLGTAVLVGRGQTVKAAASPIVLVWRPWYNFPGATSSEGQKLLYEGTAPFRAQNPGIDFKITFLGYQDTTAAAILAGAGPDVFEDWIISDYTDRGLLLNLQPYIQRDNLDLTVLPAGMVRYLEINGQSAPAGEGFYALPDYLHTLGQAVNEDVLDQLGMKYPEPDWTYQQWAEFWLQTSSKTLQKDGKPRVGGGLYWWSGHGSGAAPGDWYWHAWGGDFVNPNNNTQPMIDAPGSVAFAEYFVGLINEGALAEWGDATGFITGSQVSLPRGSAGGLPWSATNWRNVKWSLYPMPTGAAGQFTAAFESFYAASADTQYPEQCWEFIKWLCYEKTWPRYMMRLALQGPIRRDLWTEWQTIVEAVAPPLRHVNLGGLVAQVEADNMWSGTPFRYYDSQCGDVINKYVGMILAKQISVAGGLAQASQQMAALQRVGNGYQGDLIATRAFEAYLAKARASSVTFATPAPSRTDFGSPPQAAASLIAYRATTGTYTVTGGGTGLTGSSDGGTFACAAFRRSRGTFACRLTAITAVKDTSIAGGAKIGLMIRSSLSSGAATACLDVALGHSVQFFSRPFPGSSPTDQNTPGGGLLAGTGLLANNAKPASNYLLKPLWLKLVGTGGQWMAYTSLDGTTWAQAGTMVLVDAEGVWVGLFVTSHDSGHFIRATFDSLVGLPKLNTFVQFGSNVAESGTT